MNLNQEKHQRIAGILAKFLEVTIQFDELQLIQTRYCQFAFNLLNKGNRSMKNSTAQLLKPTATIALLVCFNTSLVAQDNRSATGSMAIQGMETTVVRAPENERDDYIVAGFGERADDFLSRKISPKPTETPSTGWSLFGQTLSGYPAKKTAASIVLAISISLLALYVLRMKPGQRRGGLPDDVVSMLGQVPFGPNQRLQLVRLGSKLLLITTSQNGSHTLGEITDPEEVLQIEAICRNGKFDTIGQTLRNRAQAASASNTRHRQSAATAGRTLLEA